MSPSNLEKVNKLDQKIKPKYESKVYSIKLKDSGLLLATVSSYSEEDVYSWVESTWEKDSMSKFEISELNIIDITK